MARYLGFILALLATLFGFFVVSLPISVETQLVMGISVLIAMLLLRFVPGQLARMIFIAMGGVLVGRYLYWRTTQTVPPIDNLVDFIPGIILLAAEFFCIAMFFLSAMMVADPYTRPRKNLTNDADAPTVDVFIPSYNEDPGLVACTIAAACDLDYPKDKFTVYLLDDGATGERVNSGDPAVAQAALKRRDELLEICERLGAKYLARPRNERAKAGNLNFGMTESAGELIVVFDADHAPSREFLRETVAYFEDTKLGLLQTPHFFLNPDPVEKNLDTHGYMPSENDMFYGMVQRGLDKWNSAFFCGSAAVLRRTALNEVGGFAGVSITEDCETSLELHSRRWDSAYIPRPMISGLQPETLSGFIGQRSRWCRGMLQILLLKNPLFKRGLRPIQRVAYTTNTLFWLFPLSRLTFMIAPLLFLIFNMNIYVASPQEFIAYTIIYIAAVVAVQAKVYGRLRWPWISELYEYIQSVYLASAIFSVMLNPRRPKFAVTAKGETLEKDHLSGLALPYILFFAAMVIGTALFVWRLFTDPSQTTLLIVVGTWQVFNLLIAGAGLGAVLERKQVRRFPRVTTNRKVVFEQGSLSVPAVVREANANGVLIEPLSPIQLHTAIGALATIRLAGEGKEGPGTSQYSKTIELRIATQRTSPAGGALLGAAFMGDIPSRAAAASTLVYGDLTIPRMLHGRKLVYGSVTGSSFRLIRWAILSGLRVPLEAISERTSRSADKQPAAEPAPLNTAQARVK
ncbi:UDP-forming cellulose synthase catalytic subunit [Roseibium sp. RKSG952]|uniref:UDP-forming cellulose synthase catalytic subunit n=1 Tax=Roseibium sp. RKSG952 TaxID=2529384 RepID=UPI0012BB614E|nr:UDP-forming cellulose synthase catalytic subunit [Roseibium sp. RKSG952]MTH99567.1 UDP-forming cellulose synthase catalytic subunit [Roseibium sp. RKSG952]